MGIFLILAGVVLGFISLVTLVTAQAVTQQLFAGEIAICGAVLFACGAVILAINNVERALQPAKAKEEVAPPLI